MTSTPRVPLPTRPTSPTRPTWPTRPTHRRTAGLALGLAALVSAAACSSEGTAAEPRAAPRAEPRAAPSTAPTGAAWARAAGPPERDRDAPPIASAAKASAGARREAPAELVLDAEASAVVVAPMPAQILRVHVRAGDTVAIGAPIVTVVMPEAAIAAARAIAAADRLSLVEQRITAIEALIGEGLARVGDRAELAARAAELRAERSIALATLRAAGLTDAEGLLRSGGRHQLRATVGGVITAVAATVGETRATGDGPLARIVGGTGRRVMARWASAQDASADASLLLATGERRGLHRVAVAAQRDAAGTLACWYDVDGAPLAASIPARVVIGAAP